ncbi:MAG: hypothetical protein NVS1B13_19820 [Flavisolibacter sp.]
MEIYKIKNNYRCLTFIAAIGCNCVNDIICSKDAKYSMHNDVHANQFGHIVILVFRDFKPSNFKDFPLNWKIRFRDY